ncbi:hypothetical protein [Paenibacillus sp. FSL A5-0031]|nr:hypothetical protein [Paenibacillus sp. FSL A5-0031]
MILALQSAPNPQIRRRSVKGRLIARVIGALCAELLSGFVGGLMSR